MLFILFRFDLPFEGIQVGWRRRKRYTGYNMTGKKRGLVHATQCRHKSGYYTPTEDEEWKGAQTAVGLFLYTLLIVLVLVPECFLINCFSSLVKQIIFTMSLNSETSKNYWLCR